MAGYVMKTKKNIHIRLTISVTGNIPEVRNFLEK